MTPSEMDILAGIIAGVETGGLRYGKKNYSFYAGAYIITPLSVTVTLGYGCFYGNSARRLIRDIFRADIALFRKIDRDGLIEKKLESDWVKEEWNPSEQEAGILRKLIVTKIGRKCQDGLLKETIQYFIDKALEYDPMMSVQARMMWCEIAYLGGEKACCRIFSRAARPYTPESILESLRKDQEDANLRCGVGDRMFQNRHKKCIEWINEYLPAGKRKTLLSPVRTLKRKITVFAQSAVYSLKTVR